MIDARSHRYTPLDPSQWDVEIGDVAGALDELAKVGPGGIDEFDAYDAAGNVDVSTATTTVPLDTTRTNTGTTFTLASSEVTVTTAGLYPVRGRGSFEADGTAPFVQDLWIEVNGVDIGAHGFCGATGSSSKVRTIKEDTTLSTTDYTVLVDATTAAVTVTLPSSVDGEKFNIKKIDSTANAVTVSGTIDGSSSKVLASQYDAIQIVSFGTNWFIH